MERLGGSDKVVAMHFKSRHVGARGIFGKIYGPLRGALTTIIDFLSRLLLLTLKSMVVNTHLIFTT